MRGKGTGLFRFGAVNVLNKCHFPSSYFSFVLSLKEEKKTISEIKKKKIHFFTLQQVGNMNIYITLGLQQWHMQFILQLIL